MIYDSIIVTGSAQVSGSLSVTGGITGSLQGTASYAISASYATTASYVANASSFPYTGSAVITGSLAVTGSLNVTNGITGSLQGTSSYALTASFVANASSFPFTGSAIITGSLVITGSTTSTGGFTGSLFGTAATASYIQALSGYTTASRTLTINGESYDLTADRSWTVPLSGSVRTIQKFTATSNQTTFNISGGYVAGLVDVYVNGVKLDNNGDFTATNGTTVVLTVGAMLNDIVEVYNYISAFTANNTLRVVTPFTATAAQTTFSASYTPGFIDVFYNGSKLAASEYTASNGTSITLGTAAQLNDIVEVTAYSYTVGAFTGIGGSGTANYVAKFTSGSTIGTSSIYDNGTNVGISTTNPQAKLDVNGNGRIAGIIITGNPSIPSGTGKALTEGYYSVGEYAFFQGYDYTNFAYIPVYVDGSKIILNANSTGNVGINTTNPIYTLDVSGSARFTNTATITGSLNVSGSNTLIGTKTITGSVFISGSKTIIGNNIITGSLSVSGSSTIIGATTISGSLMVSGSITSNGTLTAQTLVVQTITSSVLYSSGSNVFGNSLSNTQTFTGSVGMTGSLAVAGTGTFSSSVTARNGSSGTAFITTNAVDADFTIETVSGGTTKIGTSGNKLSILAGVGNMILSKPSSDTILTIGTTGEVPTIKAGGTNTDLKLEATGSGGNLYFYTNSTLKMLVKSDGNVSIGTNSPVLTNLTGSMTIVKSYTSDTPTSTTAQTYYTNQSSLYLFGRNSGLSIISNNSEEGAIIFGNASTVAYASIKTGTAATSVGGDMYFQVGSNTERMRITTSGSVGIGTTSPLKILHIAQGGNINGVLWTDDAAGNYRNEINNTFNGSTAASNLMTFKVSNATTTGQTTVMTLNGSGNVGIGTDSPDVTGFGWKTLTIKGGTGSGNAGVIELQNTVTVSNDQNLGIIAFLDGTSRNSQISVRRESSTSTAHMDFFTNAGAGLVERMRITSGGNVGIGTTTDSGARIDARMTVAGKPVISAINNNVADSRCYYGQKYNSSTDDYYMIFDNVVANKFLFYGDGGLGNVQANDVNISDIRTKKDIIPLESYWNKFKAIEIVKFKYKDQTHDDYNIGVIAQQLEEVAPEFVNAEDWGKDTPAQTEEPLKSVYTADLYHATIKVLQEAMAKIETLETRITQLENK